MPFKFPQKVRHETFRVLFLHKSKTSVTRECKNCHEQHETKETQVRKKRKISCENIYQCSILHDAEECIFILK